MTDKMSDEEQLAWKLGSALDKIVRKLSTPLPWDEYSPGMRRNAITFLAKREPVRVEAPTQPRAEYIDIVFDGPPSHESRRFVEVEDPTGKSISVGDWLPRAGGYWALRIPRPTVSDEARALHEAWWREIGRPLQGERDKAVGEAERLAGLLAIANERIESSAAPSATPASEQAPASQTPREELLSAIQLFASALRGGPPCSIDRLEFDAIDHADSDTRALRERCERAERELAGARAEIDRWKDIAHTDAKAMEENARRIAARDANLQTLAKSLDTAERELAAAREELAVCKRARDDADGARRLLQAEVSKLWAVVESICGEGEDGESVIDTTIRILREQKAQLEAARVEVDQWAAKCAAAEQAADKVAARSERTVESMRRQLDAARVAAQRGDEIEERASQPAQAAGLPAVDAEIEVIPWSANDRPWRTKVSYYTKPRLVTPDLHLNVDDEGKTWRRIPQPEKEGK